MRCPRIAALIAALVIVLVAAVPADANLQGKVRKLSQKVNTLQGQVAAATHATSCLRTIPLTSYYGYWYGDSGFFTTALDITEAGSTVQYYVVRDTCGAIPLGRPTAKPLARPAG